MEQILIPLNIPAHICFSPELVAAMAAAPSMEYRNINHALMEFSDTLSRFGADLMVFDFQSTSYESIYVIQYPEDPAEAERRAAAEAAAAEALHIHRTQFQPYQARHNERVESVVEHLQAAEAERRARVAAGLQQRMITMIRPHLNLHVPIQVINDRPPEDLTTCTHEGVTLYLKNRLNNMPMGMGPGRLIFRYTDEAHNSGTPIQNVRSINAHTDILAEVRPTPRGWAVIMVGKGLYQISNDALVRKCQDDVDIGRASKQLFQTIGASLRSHEYATRPTTDVEACVQAYYRYSSGSKPQRLAQAKRQYDRASDRVRTQQQNMYMADLQIQEAEAHKTWITQAIAAQHQALNDTLTHIESSDYVRYMQVEERYNRVRLHLHPARCAGMSGLQFVITSLDTPPTNVSIRGLPEHHPLSDAHNIMHPTVLTQMGEAIKHKRFHQFLRNLIRMVQHPERI